MNKHLIMKRIILLLVVLVGNIAFTQAQDTKTIINKAISVLSSTNSYTFTFSSEERINGELIKAKMETKLMQSPHKIYVKNISGEKYRERASLRKR